jgi:hypothetical protein
VKTYTAQMLRCLIAAITVASLASCTQAQIEAVRIANTAGEVRNKLLACRSKIDASPQYSFIYKKLGVATAQDPMRMKTQAPLADPERVSDDASLSV